MPKQNQVKLTHISKKFGQMQAVADISLQVAAGEIFGLLGPNGAGKTTTIRMMLDILRPDTGTIEMFGGPLDEAKKNRIGYMPEERGLYAEARLIDVVHYLASLKGVPGKKIATRAESYLKRLDLWEHRKKRLKEMSRGMHQKAQFIVTILHDPDLLIVDEPFTNLDPVNTELIRTMLMDFRNRGKAIIMSTHQMHQVEAMCDRIALIQRGRVVLEGPVLTVRRQFAGSTVEVAGTGPFDQLTQVAEARFTRGRWLLTLAQGASSKELLAEIANREDLILDQFSTALPSVHEIFLRVVADNQPGEKTA